MGAGHGHAVGAVNNRDDTPYPFDDGTGQYGKVIPENVGNHPPEAPASVRQGGYYGWALCNANPDPPSGLKHMTLDRIAPTARP
ncbi:hypothetical protein [Corallococcus interemptor]|uniref:hypothetical protein n=1 Tax=Corallococcus interemptor TaxID=2316720 RepID=UPI0011C452E8|nr:hypothetical protein [Corallococcus interemptor]